MTRKTQPSHSQSRFDRALDSAPLSRSSKAELPDAEEIYRHFAHVIRAVDVGVWRCDLPSLAMRLSVEARRHFYLRGTDVVTSDVVYSRIHADDKQAVQSAVRSAIASGDIYDIEYRTVDPDNPGSIRWIRAMGRTHIEAGHPTYFDGVSIDITDRKRIERELARALARAHEALKLRDQFLSVASHELKTPVTALHLQLQLLMQEHAKTLSTVDIRTALSLCLQKSAELTGILDLLSELTRIALGTVHLERKRTDASALVNDIVSHAKQERDRRNSGIVSDVESGLIAEVDPKRLRISVATMLEHALAQPATEPVELSARRDLIGDHIVIEVTDHGAGLSAEQQLQVFDRFKLTSDPTNTDCGLGIGLYIAKHIARAHGGEIVLSSELGIGSTFTLTLPIYSSVEYGGGRVCQRISAPKADGVRG